MSSTLDAGSERSGSRPAGMKKEVFGVFGDGHDLSRLRPERAFDAVLEGDRVAVGVRDAGLGSSGRTAVHSDERGLCLVFGEAFVGGARESNESGAPVDRNAARRLLDRYAAVGRDALSELNGSHVVVLEYGGEALVATDRLRSWECFYADLDGLRAFTTDLSSLVPHVDRSRVDRTALLEFLHVGTVLGTATVFEQVRRVPFDGYLTPRGTGTLDRFVYEPREFDYVDELARRLTRAIRRRADLPGRKGLLLSGGKDSRVLLSQLPAIEHCYTIGSPDAREVRSARKVARQYGSGHTVLEPDDRYLRPTAEKLTYTQAIKESLHIHHAGYADAFDVDTLYHGALFDTLLKGYFLERDGVELFGSKLPSRRLHPDPDPIDSLLGTLGYYPDASVRLADAAGDLFDDIALDSPDEFLRERFRAELETCWERTESVHNAMDLLVIKNQPVLPFRTHIADNFFEGFIAADTDLLDWHLRTPPEHRHDDTFWRALKRIDPAIFRHRPPSQPHSSTRLNQIERFARRKLPFVEAFQPAWPDRREVYEAYGMDEELFPFCQSVRELPVRLKLRINDIRWWLD
ncbi:asparagine synthase-related protein [Halegenticoccus soli]|uniref:asparagine synthase-related protein n=1 Tax=Halegenticoccus soli TaxID=1985678 RepID=UPI000C6C9F36|nr:asparagine synthase-related protein [Halegenticoccus soli]